MGRGGSPSPTVAKIIFFRFKSQHGNLTIFVSGWSREGYGEGTVAKIRGAGPKSVLYGRWGSLQNSFSGPFGYKTCALPLEIEPNDCLSAAGEIFWEKMAIKSIFTSD